MKRTEIIISLIILLGSFSQAHATADLFECRAKITDLKTNESTESIGTAAGMRIVAPNSSTGQPYPSDIEVTSSEAKVSLTLQGRSSSYKVGFNLHYAFARRLAGNPTEARQYVCNQVELQGCQNGSCSAADNICVAIPDPFDPKYGWSVTGLAQNTPVFNEQLLRPFETIIPVDPNDPNGAQVSVSCKFQGTYF